MKILLDFYPASHLCTFSLCIERLHAHFSKALHVWSVALTTSSDGGHAGIWVGTKGIVIWIYVLILFEQKVNNLHARLIHRNLSHGRKNKFQAIVHKLLHYRTCNKSSRGRVHIRYIVGDLRTSEWHAVYAIWRTSVPMWNVAQPGYPNQDLWDLLHRILPVIPQSPHL